MTRTDQHDTEMPPFETRLLAELTDVVVDRRHAAAAERAAGRSRRTRLAVATAGVAAVALALALAPGLVAERGTPAFAVRELPNGVIEIDGFDPYLDGDALVEVLAEFGIEVRVESFHASPSLVGQAEAFVDPGEPFVPLPDQAGVTLDDAEEGTHRVSIDPAVFDGRVDIYFMIETPPGAPYQWMEEAFTDGEVLGGLHCALPSPLRVADLAPVVADLGLDVTWVETEVAEQHSDGGLLRHTEVSRPPAGTVARAVSTAAGKLEVEVYRDGARWLEGDRRPGTGIGPCTPELAERWR